MAFYDDMKKKLVKTKDEVVQKTGDYTEATKLSLSVAEQERELTPLYTELGKLCYRKCTEAPEQLDSDYEQLYRDISEHIRKKEEFQKKLYQLKGYKPCCECGEQIQADAVFCNHCGAKQKEEPKEESLSEEQQKEKAEAAPAAAAAAAEGNCPVCGTHYDAGQKSCTMCGFQFR